MARMHTQDGTGTKPRRKRREYTDEAKAGVVRLVPVEVRSVTQVAKDLHLTRPALDAWVARARADTGQGRPGTLTTTEREELTRPCRENRQLKVERDIPEKAAAFFAKERR